MKELTELLPFLIPIIFVQVLLAIISVIHVIKHPHYRFGNRILWIIVVLLIQIIGPLIYLVFGRGEEE